MGIQITLTVAGNQLTQLNNATFVLPLPNSPGSVIALMTSKYKVLTVNLWTLELRKILLFHPIGHSIPSISYFQEIGVMLEYSPGYSILKVLPLKTMKHQHWSFLNKMLTVLPLTATGLNSLLVSTIFSRSLMPELAWTTRSVSSL